VIVGEAAIPSGPTQKSDKYITNYRTANNLPPINFQSIPDAKDRPPDATALDDGYLDIDIAGPVAPGATIIYVYTANAFAAAAYAIDQNLGQIISMSFAKCELDITDPQFATFEDSLQKAMSEGITFVAGSCDTGAAGCDAKTFPSVRELPIRFARLLSRCLWEHDKSSGSCQVESRFSVETTGLVTQPTLLVLKLANKSPEPGLGPAIQLISGPQDFSTVPDFFQK